MIMTENENKFIIAARIAVLLSRKKNGFVSLSIGKTKEGYEFSTIFENDKEETKFLSETTEAELLGWLGELEEEIQE